jgi:hypothetical protein
VLGFEGQSKAKALKMLDQDHTTCDGAPTRIHGIEFINSASTVFSASGKLPNFVTAAFKRLGLE